MSCTALHTRATAQTRQIRPGVSERLLTEMPRFFDGSLRTMLRELLQNAFRAEAKNVSIAMDTAQRTLIVQDDGCGIADPNLVVQAGATGWDENRVVEPAGAGMFALLADTVEKVVVVSWRDQVVPWRMTLTPDALRGLPVSVESLETRLSQDLFTGSGTVVALTFHSADVFGDSSKEDWKKDLRQRVEKARSLYPFTVVFNLDSESSELVPYRSWLPDITLAVQGIGTLEWTAHLSSQSSEVVWAHQVIRADALERALNEAAKTDPAFAVFHRGSFRWIVDPACGVRPKLPDRTDLLDDLHLAHAARNLARAFGAHMTERVKALIAPIQDPIDINALYESQFGNRLPEPLQGLPLWMRDRDLIIAALKHLGWVESAVNHYDEYSIYHTDDGMELDEVRSTWMYRTLPTTPSYTVAFTLTQIRQPTQWVSANNSVCPSDAVQIEGLRTLVPSPHLALCKKIVVQNKELSFLLNENGFGDMDADGFDITFAEKHGQGKNAWEETHTPCILFAGSAAQFSTWLRKNQAWVIKFVAVAQMNYGSLYDYDWTNNDELDEDAILRDLLTEASAFDPKLARARQTYYAAHDAQKELEKIQQAARRLDRLAQANPHWRKMIGRSNLQLKRQCAALNQAIEKELPTLAAQAGLASSDA